MGGRALWSHEVELEAEPTSVSGARRFVHQYLDSHGMRSLMDDAELVVSELATNALAHARTPFRVSVARFDNNTVVVEVTDHSPSAPQRVRPNLFDTAGRGVSIVEFLSSDWGVKGHPGDGKTVWVSFDER